MVLWNDGGPWGLRSPLPRGCNDLEAIARQSTVESPLPRRELQQTTIRWSRMRGKEQLALKSAADGDADHNCDTVKLHNRLPVRPRALMPGSGARGRHDAQEWTRVGCANCVQGCRPAQSSSSGTSGIVAGTLSSLERYRIGENLHLMKRRAIFSTAKGRWGSRAGLQGPDRMREGPPTRQVKVTESVAS